MNARLLLIHALSPLHAGTGQGVGAIDLPIAREKATGLPYLPGASLKGTLRAAVDDPALRQAVFGSEDAQHASPAQLADARLLLLPVRSLAGTFAWVTAPYVLRRALRDARDAGRRDLPAAIPTPALSECAVAGPSSALLVRDGTDGQVVLEDLDLAARPDDGAAAWARWVGRYLFPGEPAWQDYLNERICVVHDDTLAFLLETATEVTARIAMDDATKTARKGGLWYEEALPAETVLLGIVTATRVRAGSAAVFDTIASLTAQPLQLGGKATVGRGLCRLRLVDEEAA